MITSSFYVLDHVCRVDYHNFYAFDADYQNRL